MHAIFFGLKRAHHRVIYGVSRALLRATETRLTPARFDLLDLVLRHDGNIAQWRLIELLGVTGATISRMLKSLEKLKLVVRGRWEIDARYRIVELTREGRRRVKKVLRQLVDSGGVDRIVRSALGPPRAPAGRTESARAPTPTPTPTPAPATVSAETAPTPTCTPTPRPSAPRAPAWKRSSSGGGSGFNAER